MAISKNATPTSLKADITDASFVKLALAKDFRSLWAGQVGAEKGTKPSLCQFTESSGAWTVAKKVVVDYFKGTTPNDTMAAPVISGIVIDSANAVWASESVYGMVYFVAADKSTADIVYPTGKLNEGQQLWAMTNFVIKDIEYVCVLDTHASILLISTKDKIVNAPVLLTQEKDMLSYTFTFHELTRVLWVLLQNENATNFQLCSLPIGSDLPKASDIKPFSGIQGADLATVGYIKADPKRNLLYAGTSTGKVLCFDISKKDTAPTLLWTTTVSTANPPPALDFLEVDPAGYVWTGDHGSDDTKPGHIYGLEPALGTVIVDYTLDKGTAKREVVTAVMAWLPDALMVADDDNNSQVLRIDVTDTGPIDANGKATYKLAFTPSAGTASLDETFASVQLSAKSNTGNTSVNAIASLSVDKTNVAALQTTKSPVQVPNTANGLAIADLKATHTEGTVILTASSRGASNVTFTGTVSQKLTSVVLEPKKPRYVAQGGEFRGEDMPKVTVGPAGSTKPVDVTLSGSGEATFDKPGTPKTTTVIPGDSLPPVKAGKKAGEVTVTAAKDGIQDVDTWFILPIPTVINGKFGNSYNNRNFTKEATAVTLTLQGHETLGDTNSPLVPVQHWNVRVKIDQGDAAFDSQKVPQGSNVDPKGKWIILQTTAQGTFNIPFDKLKSAPTRGTVQVTVAANDKFDGSEGANDGQWIRATATYILHIV